ncbi:hypothetical protein AVEN_187037-1 [Araneus ventricosus]|uniref:Uncharacterized protein n=1 Tax=Araneus ventricosus TaxID=182803 RepID=A0A4Y2HBI2_ARAVE|nr:hypothetical protein AVEN_187037-1 [Araneus ventricosus]
MHLRTAHTRATEIFHKNLLGSGDLVVWSRPRGRGVLGSKPDSTEELPRKRVWCTLNPSGPNILMLVWFRSLEREVPAQVSSTSSDKGSKLRGPSQNSPRVSSERDVNMTKLPKNRLANF